MIFIDTETTGLDPERNAVIEVAAVRLDPGTLAEMEVFQRNVRPWAGAEWTAEAERVHGVTETEAEDYPNARAVYGDLIRWLGPRPRIYGWNVAFDVRFLYAGFRRCGGSADWYCPFDVKTGYETAYLMDRIPADIRSLSQWCRWSGVTRSENHGALEDARLTAKAYRALVREVGR